MADFFDFIKKPVSNTSGNGVAPPNLKINGNSSVSNNNLPASADGQKKPDDKTAHHHSV